MIKHARDRSILEEKWLQDLVEKVGHQLHSRKKKDILLSEIEKRTSEIAHIEGRIAMARGGLAKTEGTIESLQRQLDDSVGESKRLRVARERAEEEFSRIKDASKDMEKKLAALPQMREEIKKLEGVVQRSARRLDALRSDYRDILHRQEGLEEACRVSKTRLTDVEQEISVMKNTFTLLTGQRPEDFDHETFEAIQDHLEKKVEEFTGEMMGEIEKVKEDTLSLEARIEEKTGLKKATVLKKGEIQEAVKRLKGQVGEERRPEDLEAELKRIKTQEGKFEVAIQDTKSEIWSLESAIATVMKRIHQEEAIGGQLSERHVYLKTRKEKMTQLGNVPEEIRGLGDEARRFKRDSKVNWSLHETVQDLIGGLEPFNRELGSALEGYKKRFSELEKEIERHLSH